MAKRGDWLSRMAVVLVAVCTLVVTLIVAWRELSHPRTGIVPSPQPPEQVDNWAELISAGHRLGPDEAPLTLLVFSDFECSSCAYFATTAFPRLAEQHPGQVALVYRHWPLTRHRLAYPAARAAECAAEQGRFWAYHDAVYEEHDALGIKGFVDFAEDVGVPQLDQFVVCIQDSQPVPVIEADIRAVRELGATGTPTVLVNGWHIRGGVDEEVLESLADELLRFAATGGGSR
jgi:protein-disulfide isomerase